VRPVGLYVCIAAVFQLWMYSRLYKKERTRQMDQQGPELMKVWKSGEAWRHAPLAVVQVAKGTPSVQSRAEKRRSMNAGNGCSTDPRHCQGGHESLWRFSLKLDATTGISHEVHGKREK
jgi:hypothetical protein